MQNFTKNELLNGLLDDDKCLDEKIDFFYESIELLVQENWDRNDIYVLLKDILESNYQKIQKELFDVIDNFYTTITGDVAPSCIYRFKGDPINDNDLAEYVRSYVWKKK